VSAHLLCHSCRLWLAPHEFHRDRSRSERDGRHVWCKPCRRDIRMAHPSRSPDARRLLTIREARARLHERLSQTFRFQSWAWFKWKGDPRVVRMGVAS
jgi:hypothetical protein